MTAHKLWWRQGHALTLALLQVTADVEAEVSVRSLVPVSLHTPSRISISFRPPPPGLDSNSGLVSIARELSALGEFLPVSCRLRRARTRESVKSAALPQVRRSTAKVLVLKPSGSSNTAGKQRVVASSRFCCFHGA